VQLQGFTRCCNQCKLSSNHNQFVYKIIFSSLKIHKLICFDRHLLWVDEFLFYPIRSLRKQAQQWLYGMFYIRHFTKRHGYSADVGRRNAAWYSPNVWSKSNFVQVCVHVVNCTCIYREYRLSTKTSTPERDWRQNERTLSVLSPSSILSPSACH